MNTMNSKLSRDNHTLHLRQCRMLKQNFCDLMKIISFLFEQNLPNGWEDVDVGCSSSQLCREVSVEVAVVHRDGDHLLLRHFETVSNYV